MPLGEKSTNYLSVKKREEMSHLLILVTKRKTFTLKGLRENSFFLRKFLALSVIDNSLIMFNNSQWNKKVFYSITLLNETVFFDFF